MNGPITSPMKSVCLSVYTSVSLTLSSGMADEVFLIFSTIIDKFLEINSAIFSGKFNFVQIWAKKTQNGPKIGFL